MDITINIILFGKVQADLDSFLLENIKNFFFKHQLLVNFKVSYEKQLMDEKDKERKQFPSGAYLRLLNRLKPRGDAIFMLGIIPGDLYSDTKSGLNFIFGEAERNNYSCIISTFRLYPGFYGFKFNKELFFERILKEALHELCHVIAGLGHCNDQLCIMHFSNTIHDTDLKYMKLCKDCSKKMKLGIKKRFEDYS